MAVCRLSRGAICFSYAAGPVGPSRNLRTASLAAVSFSIRSWVISRVTLSKTTGASTACSAASLPVALSIFFLMRPPTWAWAVPHEIRRRTAGSHRKEVLAIMVRSSRSWRVKLRGGTPRAPTSYGRPAVSARRAGSPARCPGRAAPASGGPGRRPGGGGPRLRRPPARQLGQRNRLALIGLEPGAELGVHGRRGLDRKLPQAVHAELFQRPHLAAQRLQPLLHRPGARRGLFEFPLAPQAVQRAAQRRKDERGQDEEVREL